MRWFRKKQPRNATINDMAIVRQAYRFPQLFRYKLGNPNVLVARVTVRVGLIQLYAGAEINRGITLEGLDPFYLMSLNKLVQVDYDTVNRIYSIVGVQNG